MQALSGREDPVLPDSLFWSFIWRGNVWLSGANGTRLAGCVLGTFRSRAHTHVHTIERDAAAYTCVMSAGGKASAGKQVRTLTPALSLWQKHRCRRADSTFLWIGLGLKVFRLLNQVYNECRTIKRKQSLHPTGMFWSCDVPEIIRKKRS